MLLLLCKLIPNKLSHLHNIFSLQVLIMQQESMMYKIKYIFIDVNVPNVPKVWLSFRDTASLTLLNLLRADIWVLLTLESWLESFNPSNVECRAAGKLNLRLCPAWRFVEVEGPATGRTSSMAAATYKIK
jgi:hypothetical protein